MKLKPKHRRVIIKVSTVAVVVLSVIGIYLGLQIVLATDRPFVAVAGGSMRPTLEIGDLLIIQGTSPTNIQPGDIIVFDTPGTNHTDQTVHRVNRTRTLPNGTIQFKTKGDANPNEDLQWIPEQNVHGRVIHRIPYIGWLALDPTIPIIIVSIVVIIIILWPEKRRKLRR